jgi:hypothetical protein
MERQAARKPMHCCQRMAQVTQRPYHAPFLLLTQHDYENIHADSMVLPRNISRLSRSRHGKFAIAWEELTLFTRFTVRGTIRSVAEAPFPIPRVQCDLSHVTIAVDVPPHAILRARGERRRPSRGAYWGLCRADVVVVSSTRTVPNKRTVEVVFDVSPAPRRRAQGRTLMRPPTQRAASATTSGLSVKRRVTRRPLKIPS